MTAAAPARQRSAKRRPWSKRREAATADEAEVEHGEGGVQPQWVARSTGWTGLGRAVGEEQGLAQRRTDPNTSPGAP